MDLFNPLFDRLLILMYGYLIMQLKENSTGRISYFRLSVTLLICFNLLSCSNKEYPDLSHLSLQYFDYERDCKRNNQCKSIGYGVSASCAKTKSNVAGYIVYSTAIGHANIDRLKRLAEDSRDRSQDCKDGLGACKDRRVVLEEVTGGCTIHRKPALFCHNGKCPERNK